MIVFVMSAKGQGEGRGVEVQQRLALDEPQDVEEVLDRARELQWARRLVAVGLLSLVEKFGEERVVEMRYGDLELPETTISFFFEPHAHHQPSLLHLHPLVVPRHLLVVYKRMGKYGRG